MDPWCNRHLWATHNSAHIPRIIFKSHSGKAIRWPDLQRKLPWIRDSWSLSSWSKDFCRNFPILCLFRLSAPGDYSTNCATTTDWPNILSHWRPQVAQEIEESKKRKAIEEEKKRKEDERIQDLQTARRQAEIEKDLEEKRMKREKEKEMARLVVLF